MIEFDIGVDLFPLLAGTLAAITCGLLGNFLVLRRLSLMGDAISHSVLPGLVIAFLIASTRNPLVMFAGAAIAGVVTVVLVELVKRLGRVEPGAAMGVVFSVLFAFGVLLIEKAAARSVDLDADCVLHGQLETLFWIGAPERWVDLFSWSTLDAAPRQVVVLAIMCFLSVVFIAALFKELRIAAFDPAMATAQGFNPTLMHYVLMIFVASATVASFEAVGSILVIAMLVCPAATARLLTDRLRSQIVFSVIIAAATGILGYFAATAIPGLFDRGSVNAAGSMAMVAGFILSVAIVLAPRHGVVVRVWRRRRLGRSVAVDDLIAALYRAEERGMSGLSRAGIRNALVGRAADNALARVRRRGLVDEREHEIVLTPDGRRAAAALVRRHRLWERYLVDQAGLPVDHVHETAEELEHVDVTPAPAQGQGLDPHGRLIPDEDADLDGASAGHR